MLKLPEPVETTNLKVKMNTATKSELDLYVQYLKSKQPHATTDVVVETIISNAIPRTGVTGKAFKQFKNSLKGSKNSEGKNEKS